MAIDERTAAARIELAPAPTPEPAADGPATVERRDVGFDLDGEFYPLKMRTGHPKDLLLLDRLTNGRGFELANAASEAAEAEDGSELEERYGITWTICLIATSIRAKHPDWSVERIYDRIMAIDDLDAQVVWIGGDEEVKEVPPELAPATAPRSTSSPDGSSSLPTPEGSSSTAT